MKRNQLSGRLVGEPVRGQPPEEGHHRGELDELGQAAAVPAAGCDRPLRHVRLLLAQEDPLLLGQAAPEDHGRNVLHLVRSHHLVPASFRFTPRAHSDYY